MEKEKILYIYTNEATFVKRDIEMLSNRYQVISHSFFHPNKFFLFLLFFKELLFLLQQIWGVKTVITMFGGYHSLLPALFCKILNKDNFIILGGTDCVSFPSINYGNFRKQPYAWFTKWSFKLCSRLLPVHESLIFYEYTYYDGDFSKQGCKAFCPDLKVPFTVIYNGYDSNFWKKEPEIAKKENQFITIASMRSPEIIKLKGIDLILEVAAKFPDCTFHIIGAQKNSVLPKASSNVIFHPFSKATTLRKILSESRFYLQLSISEGFPNALCEAMLCECIPIGSKVGGIPTIIGKTGWILEKRDTELLEKTLISALENSSNLELEKASRERILHNFSHSLREKALVKAIETRGGI